MCPSVNSFFDSPARNTSIMYHYYSNPTLQSSQSVYMFVIENIFKFFNNKK